MITKQNPETENPMGNLVNQEKLKIRRALDEFRNLMQDRLYEQVDAGKSGWDNPDNQVYVEVQQSIDVTNMLRHGDRSTLVDQACRAMILWFMDKVAGEKEDR